MHITKEDIDLMKEGLFDLTSDQNREKMQEIRKRMNEQQRIINRSNRSRKGSTKSGARFSQDTKDVLDQHIQDLRSVAKKAHAMARELKMHAQDLEQKANDLTALYQSEGQGPAFATD
jgi:methyl-accepting chemotaxis protein